MPTLGWATKAAAGAASMAAVVSSVAAEVTVTSTLRAKALRAKAAASKVVATKAITKVMATGWQPPERPWLSPQPSWSQQSL